MKHWTYPLIGLPWEPLADGPHSFYCWGLVRYVAKLRLGLDMPMVQVGGEHNVPAIKQAAREGGWRQVEGEQLENDIVMMASATGRHVGYMVAVDTRLMLLHCNGRMTQRGPVGNVMLQQLRHVACDGYGQFETWRRA